MGKKMTLLELYHKKLFVWSYQGPDTLDLDPQRVDAHVVHHSIMSRSEISDRGWSAYAHPSPPPLVPLATLQKPRSVSKTRNPHWYPPCYISPLSQHAGAIVVGGLNLPRGLRKPSEALLAARKDASVDTRALIGGRRCRAEVRVGELRGAVYGVECGRP